MVDGRGGRSGQQRYDEGSLVSELQAEGRYGTFHISTFGCQMNARDSEALRNPGADWLKGSGVRECRPGAL